MVSLTVRMCNTSMYSAWTISMAALAQRCYIAPVIRPRKYLSLLLTEITTVMILVSFPIHSWTLRNCNGDMEDIFAKFPIISCHQGRMVLLKWIFDDYSEVFNKHGVFLILFEKNFPTTCLIRTSTFIHFWWKIPSTRLLEPPRLFILG